MLATVIIPNFNGYRFLKPCLEALALQTADCFDVIVVDNGSSDLSVPYIKEMSGKDRRFRGIFLESNTGFAPAVNRGISEASSKYVILLNNDTVPEPSYIEKLVNAMDADTTGRLFAATPMMVSLADPGVLDDAGDGYTLPGWAFQHGTGQNACLPVFNRKRRVFSACAGAAAYRRDLLEKLRFSDGGYFDERHFAYLEDIDLSFRARNRGYEIIYVPDSVVRHAGSATSGSKYNDFKVRLSSRNNVWINLKNMPLPFLVINLPFLAAGLIVKQLFFSARGFGKAYFTGFLEGIGSLPETLERRREALSSFSVYHILSECFLVKDSFSYLAEFVSRRFLSFIQNSRQSHSEHISHNSGA